MLGDVLADLADAAREQSWADAALCAQADPDTWFPEKGHNEQTQAAKATCRRCPVAGECLAYALGLEDDLMGVWGGTTQAERRIMRCTAA